MAIDDFGNFLTRLRHLKWPAELQEISRQSEFKRDLGADLI